MRKEEGGRRSNSLKYCPVSTHYTSSLFVPFLFSPFSSILSSFRSSYILLPVHENLTQDSHTKNPLRKLTLRKCMEERCNRMTDECEKTEQKQRYNVKHLIKLYACVVSVSEWGEWKRVRRRVRESEKSVITGKKMSPVMSECQSLQ